jgi:WD40 repeat protein
VRRIAGDRLDTWFTSDGTPQYGVRAAPGGRLLIAAYNSDGSQVVAGTDDGRTVLWTPPADDVETLGQGEGPVTQVAFSADGVRVLSVTARDHMVRVWTLGRPEPDELRLDRTPTVALFDGASKRILVGTARGPRRWSTARAGSACRWPGPRASAGQRARPRSARTTGWWWSAEAAADPHTTSAVPWSPQRHPHAARPTRSRASGTRAQATHLPAPAAVTSVAWDRAGERLAAGRADGVAQIWKLPDRGAGKGEVLETLRGHTDQVSSVSFSPGGTWVVTGSRDGTARVWSARTGTATARSWATATPSRPRRSTPARAAF